MNFHTRQLENILFLDIETASQQSLFTEMSASMQSHWRHKVRHKVNVEDYPTFEEEFSALYHDRAAIFAEFGKVICISLGYLTEKSPEKPVKTVEPQPQLLFKVKTISGKDEDELLTNFINMLDQYWYDRHNQYLCGHNIREFDVPFLCRRIMAHGLKMPNLLNIAGQRPWQVHHLIDTMELWKFGDYKHYTSLDLLCSVLQIESPKGEMEGSEVSQAYWDGRINEIIEYCQKDVIATARVYLKYTGREPFTDEVVTIVA